MWQFWFCNIGALQLDKRVTDRMLRWVLVDIKRSKEPSRKGVLTIKDSHVKFISGTDSSDVLLQHNVHSIAQFCRCQRDRKCLFYLQRNTVDAPYVMFAFLCQQEDQVGITFGFQPIHNQSIQRGINMLWLIMVNVPIKIFILMFLCIIIMLGNIIIFSGISAICCELPLWWGNYHTLVSLGVVRQFYTSRKPQ